MKHIVRSLIALALLATSGLAGCGSGATTSDTVNVRRSLAQVGGVRVVVQLACPPDQDCSTESVTTAEAMALQQRAVRGLDVPYATATPTGAGVIAIALPGYTQQQAARQALTAQGIVEFLDTGAQSLAVGAQVEPNQYPVVATGSNVLPKSVAEGLQPYTHDPYLTCAFDSATTASFALYTSSHIGQYLTITLDGAVIRSVTIMTEIGGPVQIGMPTLDDAVALAADLKSTPLPQPVTLISADLVSASGE